MHTKYGAGVFSIKYQRIDQISRGESHSDLLERVEKVTSNILETGKNQLPTFLKQPNTVQNQSLACEDIFVALLRRYHRAMRREGMVTHVERLVFYCRRTSASTAPCTSRRMCCPTLGGHPWSPFIRGGPFLDPVLTEHVSSSSQFEAITPTSPRGSLFPHPVLTTCTGVPRS